MNNVEHWEFNDGMHYAPYKRNPKLVKIIPDANPVTRL